MNAGCRGIMDDKPFEVQWDLTPGAPLAVGQSLGGPYDDLALGLGWFLGALHTVLKYTNPQIATLTIPAVLHKQVDLMAMELGYITSSTDAEKVNFVRVVFRRSSGHPLDHVHAD